MFGRAIAGVVASAAFAASAGAQILADMPMMGPLALAAIDISPVSPPPPHDLQVGPDLSYLAEFQQRLEQVMARPESVGLAIAVLEEGRPVMIFTAGEEEAGSGRPITARTVFRAASVSKGMTGTLLAVLESQGRLDLTQPVPRELLPLPRGLEASALQVLGQRTGLPPHAMDRRMEGGANVSLLREQISTLRPVCAPGECYTYQNIAFGGLEVISAQATGMPFDTAMRAFLFDRVGMRDASIGAEALRLNESWARPHRRRDRDSDGNPQAGDPFTVYDAAAAAAGVNVSITDMIAWARAHTGHSDALSQQVRDRVHTPVGASPGQTRRLFRLADRVQDTAYALGWRIYTWNGRRLLTHSGYISGYGAQIYIEPDTGFAFVALWNHDGNAPWWIFPTLMDLRTGDGPGDWLDQLDD